jgi:hypothetical protein
MSNTENVNITNPIEVQSDTKARVAYDLMLLISRKEDDTADGKKTRDYWLTLYSQCHKAASGTALKYVLELK